ncbi:Flagellar attachment zone protein 1 [Symbiodinium microadriaticum]|uniref:Flagellar attachment zone protein 1 n=1 Tax=Symbiodinium microadriaticum TaxID=2951 RepID=A0A1Q9CY18_SYMMI|nr:Flagellar attachment zone protein 1 [Symbiodinium microadriaticum]
MDPPSDDDDPDDHDDEGDDPSREHDSVNPDTGADEKKVPHQAPVPAPRGVHLQLLTEGMPAIFTIEGARRSDHRQAIADQLRFSEQNMTLQASKPRINDVVFKGHHVHSVLIATEAICRLPVPPARVSPKTWLLIYDLRDLLLPCTWSILYCDTISVQEVIRAHQDGRPNGYIVSITGAPIENRPSGPVFRIVSGQVLHVAFVPDEPVTSEDPGHGQDHMDTDDDLEEVRSSSSSTTSADQGWIPLITNDGWVNLDPLLEHVAESLPPGWSAVLDDANDEEKWVYIQEGDILTVSTRGPEQRRLDEAEMLHTFPGMLICFLHEEQVFVLVFTPDTGAPAGVPDSEPLDIPAEFASPANHQDIDLNLPAGVPPASASDLIPEGQDEARAHVQIHFLILMPEYIQEVSSPMKMNRPIQGKAGQYRGADLATRMAHMVVAAHRNPEEPNILADACRRDMLGLRPNTTKKSADNQEGARLWATFLTVNVQSLQAEEDKNTTDQKDDNFPGRAGLLRAQLDQLGVSVAALQETRAPRSETIQSKTHVRFCSARDEQGSFGTEIWFSKLQPFIWHDVAPVRFCASDFLVVHWDPRIVAVQISGGKIYAFYSHASGPQGEGVFATGYLASQKSAKFGVPCRHVLCRLLAGLLRDVKQLLHETAVRAVSNPVRDTVQRLRDLTGGGYLQHNGGLRQAMLFQSLVSTVLFHGAGTWTDVEVPEIWALAHWEGSWLALVRASVHWLWEQVDHELERPSAEVLDCLSLLEFDDLDLHKEPDETWERIRPVDFHPLSPAMEVYMPVFFSPPRLGDDARLHGCSYENSGLKFRSELFLSAVAALPEVPDTQPSAKQAGELWNKFLSSVPGMRDSDSLAVVQDFGTRLAALSEKAQQGSKKCIVHGDFRSENIFLDSKGDTLFIDFKHASIGCPSSDAGLFCERNLLDATDLTQGKLLELLDTYWDLLQNFDGIELHRGVQMDEVPRQLLVAQFLESVLKELHDGKKLPDLEKAGLDPRRPSDDRPATPLERPKALLQEAPRPESAEGILELPGSPPPDIEAGEDEREMGPPAQCVIEVGEEKSEARTRGGGGGSWRWVQFGAGFAPQWFEEDAQILEEEVSAAPRQESMPSDDQLARETVLSVLERAADRAQKAEDVARQRQAKAQLLRRQQSELLARDKALALAEAVQQEEVERLRKEERAKEEALAEEAARQAEVERLSKEEAERAGELARNSPPDTGEGDVGGEIAAPAECIFEVGEEKGGGGGGGGGAAGGREKSLAEEAARQAEPERLRKEEEERAAKETALAEEAARQAEAERLLKEEEARVAKETALAEEVARQAEAERLLKEEEARVAKETALAEEVARQAEAERLLKEEEARVAKETALAEEVARQAEAERLLKEEEARVAKETALAEEVARQAEAERLLKEEEARVAKETALAEEVARQAEAERLLKEEEARVAKALAEEAAKKAEAERLRKEEEETVAKEKALAEEATRQAEAERQRQEEEARVAEEQALAEEAARQAQAERMAAERAVAKEAAQAATQHVLQLASANARAHLQAEAARAAEVARREEEQRRAAERDLAREAAEAESARQREAEQLAREEALAAEAARIADAERLAAELAVAVEASRMACKRILEVSMSNASAHLRAEAAAAAELERQVEEEKRVAKERALVEEAARQAEAERLRQEEAARLAEEKALAERDLTSRIGLAKQEELKGMTGTTMDATLPGVLELDTPEVREVDLSGAEAPSDMLRKAVEASNPAGSAGELASAIKSALAAEVEAEEAWREIETWQTSMLKVRAARARG